MDDTQHRILNTTLEYLVMGKSRRTYRWFVEPVGLMTNRSVADFLEVTEEDQLQIETKDNKGQTHRHYVYECSREQLNSIKHSLGQAGLIAHFWVQEGNGKFRSWPPKKKKKSLEALKAQGVFSFAKNSE